MGKQTRNEYRIFLFRSVFSLLSLLLFSCSFPCYDFSLKAAYLSVFAG
jgi:hypothetical protein